MKKIIILIFLLGISTIQSQSINDLLEQGDVTVLEQAESKKNGELQIQIEYNRELINSLLSKVKELEYLIKQLSEVEVKKSQLLIKFEDYVLIGKDYLYIYKKFTKNDLKLIAEELGLSTDGYKKTISERIEIKIKQN